MIYEHINRIIRAFSLKFIFYYFTNLIGVGRKSSLSIYL
jgi:hypothetical protein